MIDHVTAKLGRKLYEVPVGFKWFVDGLLDGSLGFGGEESAGASFRAFGWRMFGQRIKMGLSRLYLRRRYSTYGPRSRMKYMMNLRMSSVELSMIVLKRRPPRNKKKY